MAPAFQHSVPLLCAHQDVQCPSACLSFCRVVGGVIWDGRRARRGHARENPPPQCESLFSPYLCDVGLFPLNGSWPATLLGGHTVARCDYVTVFCA